MSQITICIEIQNMISFLVENLSNSNLNLPDWDTFEFITEKTGRRGPSKEECIGYYKQRSVFHLISIIQRKISSKDVK